MTVAPDGTMAITDGRTLAVRSLLESYTPADEREGAFRDRMLLLAQDEHPFDRRRFHPGHFTASAFVLSPDREALLLILHRKLGLWLQPGGHVDPEDPSVLAAARREAAEEVGLGTLAGDDRLFDIDIHAIPARPGEPTHQHFDLRFLLVAPSHSFVASSEVAGAEWVPLSQVARRTPDESVQRAIRKIAPG